MADFPDFTIPKWDVRDWAGKVAEFKTWALYSATPVAAGGTLITTIYTIPADKVFYYADSYLAAEFSGRIYFYILESYFLHLALVEPYKTSLKTASIPLTAAEGEIIKLRAYNEDIIAGRGRYGLTGWEMSASNPKSPKKDDPEERYKLGDFNFANIILLPDGESSIIFGKKGERKRNYLKVKKFYEPGEKKLASFHLKLDEAQEIMSTIHADPKKVRPILKKYEERYKLKSPKFGD